MREWIKPEISTININMTENGHNHQKWEEFTRSEDSQSGTKPAQRDSTPASGDTDENS